MDTLATTGQDAAIPNATSHDPFASAPALERQFADGLGRMLEHHSGLGVYILVLANAAYEPGLWARLMPALSERHARLARSITEALRQGLQLADPEDDLMVFLKLHAIGFEHLRTVESRRSGPWHMMFNPIRALRPPRNSGQAFTGLQRPFDPAGFHFNKPFLAKEVLWEGALSGKPARLLYNKFPFARLHGLLVPSPLENRPQSLTPELHGWAWDVATQSQVSGLCLGYNSLGAGASVNHLHFQSFVQADPLPVEDARFAHNGGSEPYPVPCHRYTEADAAWLHLDQLHQDNQPYNLIYSRNGLYLIARAAQDSDSIAAHCRGYGWSEMAGALTLFSREAYDASHSAAFSADLAQFQP